MNLEVDLLLSGTKASADQLVRAPATVWVLTPTRRRPHPSIIIMVRQPAPRRTPLSTREPSTLLQGAVAATIQLVPITIRLLSSFVDPTFLPNFICIRYVKLLKKVIWSEAWYIQRTLEVRKHAEREYDWNRIFVAGKLASTEDDGSLFTFCMDFSTRKNDRFCIFDCWFLLYRDFPPENRHRS